MNIKKRTERNKVIKKIGIGIIFSVVIFIILNIFMKQFEYLDDYDEENNENDFNLTKEEKIMLSKSLESNYFENISNEDMWRIIRKYLR